MIMTALSQMQSSYALLIVFLVLRTGTSMERDITAHWFGQEFLENSDVFCRHEHLAWALMQPSARPVTTMKAENDAQNRLLAHVWCIDTGPPERIPDHEVLTDGPFKMYCVNPAPLVVLPELKTFNTTIVGSKAFCIPESRKAHMIVGRLEYRCLDSPVYDSPTWADATQVFVLAWTQVLDQAGTIQYIRQSLFNIQRVNDDPEIRDTARYQFSKRPVWSDAAQHVPAAWWNPPPIHAKSVDPFH